MSDFLTELRQSNDKLALLAPIADAAAKHERHADTSKGSAGILTMYMIAAAIRTGAFYFPNVANPKLSSTLTPDHARGIARLWFGRYDDKCKDDEVLKTRGEIITRKDGDQGASAYIRDAVAMLYPYTCLGVTYDVNFKSDKTVGWEVTRGTLVAMLDRKLKDARIKRAEYDTQLKVLDNIDMARAMARRYFPLACLHVCLDTTGERLAASNMNKLYLSCVKSWFMMPDQALTTKDGPCVIKPARGEAVVLYYGVPNEETGSDSNGKPKSVNASIDQLTKAWTVSKPKHKGSDATDLLTAFRLIAANGLREDFTPDERKAFDAAYNVMVSRWEAIAAATKRDNKGPQPAPTSNSPEDDAHTIANRANVNLLNGTQG